VRQPDVGSSGVGGTSEEEPDNWQEKDGLKSSPKLCELYFK
jgi:hypothetical protein